MIPIGTREYPPRRRFPIVTIILVLTNVAMFAWELSIQVSGGDPALSDFFMKYGTVPAYITSGDHGFSAYLTLVSSMFLHGGFLHIASNMVFLLAFGDNVEDRMGPALYLVFYFLAGIAAGLAQVLAAPSSLVPGIGASGAIAGVLGAYLVLFPRGLVRVFLVIWLFVQIAWVPALLFIGLWFVLQLFSGIGSLGVATQQTGGVAYWAHIGGFISGVVLALLLRPLLRPTPHMRRRLAKE